MSRAKQLALKAKGDTSPNPLVGAVIVKGREVIAEGWHHRCGCDHAEIIALKKAGRRAEGAKMYVTLEPCYHYGRTPPCVDRVIASGIKEVIIGTKDPNPLTNGKSMAKLRRAGIKVKVGILQQDLKAINEPFFKYAIGNMPFIAVKSAQSLDGKIATAAGQSKWITSNAARQYARKVRDEFDAILVGINTVLKDDPRLNGSRKTKHLKKIILDSSLRIPLKARLFARTAPSDVFVATTAKAPRGKKAILQKKGATVIVCPQRKGRLDLRWLFKELAGLKITSILIEGGAHVIGNALQERLVDKAYIYMAPIILGDQNALSSVVGIGTSDINRAVRLKRMVLRQIKGDIFLEGYLK
ncbi:MAG TPA: bifunctional diaminohydroxyphosphoribosylaminopyrimidine deaminase/5-amino-6-(5-phosphoribosylamino)uracil reductase RibD [Candidatus Omnitrophota bacterium]|nr:bifunctional diaminohydroxyphosphoribosylaminopyrimidine deaminase/5-amino-6-(5-phosphoribosylamino)uracil reductase RibD [Candidatus Omnitrophota bacterium]